MKSSLKNYLENEFFIDKLIYCVQNVAAPIRFLIKPNADMIFIHSIHTLLLTNVSAFAVSAHFKPHILLHNLPHIQLDSLPNIYYAVNRTVNRTVYRTV